MRTAKMPVISVIDDALDTAAMTVDTMVKYYETRDITLLHPYLKPGKKPTIYHIRPVPHSLWHSFVLANGKDDEVRRAFMCGIERVENLRGADDVGVNWAPTRRVSETLIVMTDEECYERFSPYEVLEIGTVIHRHSFLPLRMSAPFPLQSLCVEALTHLPFRSAEQNPSTAPTASNSQLSKETGHPQEATVSS